MTAQLDRPRILCVDDEPAVLEGLRDTLRRHYDVTTATGGLEGLAALRRSSFAVVVSDMRMPQMDGATFLAHARDEAPDTVRVLLTGHADVESAIAAVTKGEIVGFLTKPCPQEALLEALAEAVERHRQILSERALLEEALQGRARVELALHESAEQFRTVFEQAIVVMATVSLTGRFVQVNPALCELVGYRADELLSKRLSDLTHPDDLESVGDLFATSLAKGPALQMEKRFVHKDGSDRWVMFNASLVRNAAGEPSCVIVEALDISERKRREERALHSQKMETVGQLAAGVAHDFNNLIMAISGFAELAHARSDGNEPLHDAIDQIQQAADQATELTSQLLPFSRRDTVAPQVIELNGVVTEAVKLLDRVLGEHIEIVTSLDDCDGWVKIDRTQVHQMLLNLAVNARDAMPDGGTLTIQTADVEIGQTTARALSDAHPGPHVKLAVTDTGHGMDVATQARIFEPFFTTKKPGAGTGLGLATVYGIVKQHRGFINVVSNPDNGASIELYLPAAPGKPRQGQAELASAN